MAASQGDGAAISNHLDVIARSPEDDAAISQTELGCWINLLPPIPGHSTT